VKHGDSGIIYWRREGRTNTVPLLTMDGIQQRHKLWYKRMKKVIKVDSVCEAICSKRKFVCQCAATLLHSNNLVHGKDIIFLRIHPRRLFN
jgi:hypothetical protein